MNVNATLEPSVASPARMRLPRSLLFAPIWLLAVWLMAEGLFRAGAWVWRGPPAVHPPLARSVLHPNPRSVPGVAPVARVIFDSRGLRGSPSAARIEPEILVLGSSTLECAYLDQAHTVHAVMAEALSRRLGRPIVAASAAGSGFLAWHEWKQAEALLPHLPGVRCVFIMPGVTDLNRWLRGTPPEVTPDMREKLFPADPFFLAHETLPGFERMTDVGRAQIRRLMILLGIWPREEDELDQAGDSQERWRNYRRQARKVPLPEDRRETLPAALAFYERCLIGTIQACQSRDIEIIIATQPLLYAEEMTEAARRLWWNGNLGPKSADSPYLLESDYASSLEDFNEVTRRVAQRLNAPLVDLASAMTEGEGRYFYDTLHFNDAGAAEAGNRIAGAVMERRILTGSPDLTSARLEYGSSIDAGPDGSPLRLYADLYYRQSWRSASQPMAIVMHGLRQDASSLSVLARAYRAEGFFTVVPEMRGRGGSEGAPDVSGREIQDIVDAVDAVAARYAEYADPSRVLLEGFSGGGGNALAAAVRYPQRWSLVSSWFGISDYGLDPACGFYQQSTEGRRAWLRQWIGDPAANPAARERYAARSAVLAAGNVGNLPVHLFVERDESICPPCHHDRFADAARAAGASRVFNHVGDAGLWRHGIPDWFSLLQTHKIILPDGPMTLTQVVGDAP